MQQDCWLKHAHHSEVEVPYVINNNVMPFTVFIYLHDLEHVDDPKKNRQ